MKLIAGLGNPGSKYRNTRHNLGFMVVDVFIRGEGLSWRVDSDLLCYLAKGQDLVVIKPTTFMNKSGEAVEFVASFFKIDASDILVIHDDLDLPFGKIRMSFDSMAAGHKGVQSVIESLSGPDFARLRVGIDRSSPEASDGKGDPEKYVLEDFSMQEKKGLDELIGRCSVAIKSYLDGGTEATMNRFN